MAKIAVIGGGLFGITSAIHLARAGHGVHLFERNRDILQESSGINQFRLHRGYHYPRSRETVESLISAEPLFRREYQEALIDEHEAYYCIAKNGSLVSGKKYLDFCRTHGLEVEIVKCPLVNPKAVEFCLKARESIIDPEKLYKICWERLKKHGVKVNLGKEVLPSELQDYDIIVAAGYANHSVLVKDHSGMAAEYQYEVCEKPVVRLPEAFAKKGIVIMDGPFMCVDPFGRTGLFILGNVIEAIHQTNIGTRPFIDEALKSVLNRGVVRNPPVTKFRHFIEAGSRFIPELKRAKQVGSMFTVRTVLPYQEATDARPTIVSAVDKNFISIFSGKLVNCVEAAEDVVRMVSG